LGAAYFNAYPVNGKSPRLIGGRFAEFLAKAEPSQEQIMELAEFEWALHAARYAPRAPFIRLSDLDRITPHELSGMKLLLHPSVKMLRMRWNVPELVRALHAREQSVVLGPGPAPVAYAVWRREDEVFWRELSIQEAAAFEATQNDLKFRQVRNCLLAWMTPKQSMTHSAALLRRWVCDEWVTDVELETDGHWLMFKGKA
jgi:hypothetical protein